jgi:hypothetical protein
MIRTVILLTLISCGSQEKDCMPFEEARLRCQADAIGRLYPAPVSPYELNLCEPTYPAGGCY